MIRVLVIDDEIHVRKLYEDLMTREGFQVQSAADVESALKAINKEQFDIIILDIELEKESGMNALKDFKSLNPNLPIILNSAYSIYMSDFHSWMADAYIIKSSDIRPLIDKIRELAISSDEYEQEIQ